jgi:hypothetical protein
MIAVLVHYSEGEIVYFRIPNPSKEEWRVLTAVHNLTLDESDRVIESELTNDQEVAVQKVLSAISSHKMNCSQLVSSDWHCRWREYSWPATSGVLPVLEECRIFTFGYVME